MKQRAKQLEIWGWKAGQTPVAIKIKQAPPRRSQADLLILTRAMGQAVDQAQDQRATVMNATESNAYFAEMARSYRSGVDAQRRCRSAK